MKVLLIVMLTLNLVTELLAATSLIGGPDGLAAAGKGGMWSMHYGFAALAIASASLWVWPYRTHLPTLTAVVGILTTFHIGLVVSLAAAGDQNAGMIIHAVHATLCVVLFLKRRTLCTA